MRVVLLGMVCLHVIGLSAQREDQNYINQHYLIQQRVSHGLVFDILQDRLGYMWFATEHGLVRFDGMDEKIYRHDPLDESSVSSDAITCLAEDSLGNLWVGTMYAGLNYFDRKHNRFLRFPSKNDSCSPPANKINKILIDRDGLVWVSTEGGGLCWIDQASRCFNRIQKPRINTHFTDALFENRDGTLWMGSYFGLNRKKGDQQEFDSLPLHINKEQFLRVLKVIEEDGEGMLWLGTRDQGLLTWDKTSGSVKQQSLSTLEPQNPGVNNIWDIMADTSGVLWVCTDGGLSIVEKNKAPYIISSLDQNGLRRVLSVFKSRDGVIWLGTNSGVVVLTPRLKPFDLIRVYTEPGDSSIKRGVSFVTAGRDGRIWIGTTKGLYTYLPEDRLFSRAYLQEYPALKALSASTIFAFYQDRRGHFWISTVLDFNTGFEVYRYEPELDRLISCSPQCEPFRAHVTQNILEDHQQNLWFANGMGLIRYDLQNNQYHQFKSGPSGNKAPASDYINRLLISSDHYLWVGTNDAGLNKFTAADLQFVHYDYKAGDSNALSNKRVLHILEDHDHKLWIATAGGLNLFNPEKNTFKHYFKKDGLPDDHINGMIQDHHGLFWLSAPKALARYNALTNEFIHFDRADGLLQSEFWDRTSFRDRNNRIYFGGDDGLVVFDPDQIRLNDFLSPVVIHEIHLLNKLVVPGKENSILREDLSAGSKIVLNHRQNVFSFRFAALNYIRPDKVKYAIKMEGFEEDWQYIDTRREATYTNLNPGKYAFRVKAANNDGRWNQEGNHIQLIILAPWWNSVLARLIYAVLFVGMVLMVYRFQLNRRILAVETRRLKDMDAFKSKFYTNITHEFRTPLTLILGPVDKALKEKSDLKYADLNLVQRNARRLLQLINQLLHLSKLESGNAHLNYSPCDLVAFVKYLTESFQSYADGKNIKLRFSSDLPALVMDIDAEKLTEIISNILSNALKYTPPEGSVQVHIEMDSVSIGQNPAQAKTISIKISDTGAGIAEDKIAKIFDRYYTSNSNQMEGTGIGLAITRELTALLGGKITVQSQVNRGSVFSITLPVGRLSGNQVTDLPLPVSSSVVMHADQQEKTPEENIMNDLPLVLIIEDNADVAHFIGTCLKQQYQVYTAYNGSEGISQAIRLTPDLILSDVMMPDLDGFELTRLLKTDQRTSHIPIVLITARADEASRLEGYKHRADAYLTKPFNQEELLLIMGNLLEMRKKVQARNIENLWDDRNLQKEDQIKPLENEFIQKLRLCCENHLNDALFSIEDLCREMGMSHSQVHRKMIALTGQSIQKFFKNIRLDKAKNLLKTTGKPVAEIAYETGFSEPAYFTKVFTRDIGMNPTEWRKRNANNSKEGENTK